MKSMAYTVLPSYAYDNVRTYVQWFVESLCGKEYYYLKGINFCENLFSRMTFFDISREQIFANKVISNISRGFIFASEVISNILQEFIFANDLFFFNYFFR